MGALLLLLCWYWWGHHCCTCGCVCMHVCMHADSCAIWCMINAKFSMHTKKKRKSTYQLGIRYLGVSTLCHVRKGDRQAGWTGHPWAMQPIRLHKWGGTAQPIMIAICWTIQILVWWACQNFLLWQTALRKERSAGIPSAEVTIEKV